MRLLACVMRAQRLLNYGEAGIRASRVETRMAEAGCTDVGSLEGSIFQWPNEGRPIERDGKPADEVLAVAEK